MPALSREQLSELNPEKIYNIPTFVLHNDLWPNLNVSLVRSMNNPIKIKFDSNIRNNLGSLKDKKGIYMFIVEPEFPFTPTISYLLYVGRVISNNTFFKRFYDYVTSIGNINKRRNIQILTNLWPEKTWVYFYELNLLDNEISQLEKILYDNILPPLNNDFKSKRALNSRSIYN